MRYIPLILFTFLGIGLCASGVLAELQVRFLDVNEGDAVLLQDDGKNMLIDSGTRDSGNLTKVYLKSLGVTSLDRVLITSPEEGRTGALTNILNATPAVQIFDGGWNVSNGSYQDVLNKTIEDQITRTVVTGGQSIDFTEKVKVDIISPDTFTGDLNHDTLIPLITYGDVKFLLLGTEQIIEHPVQAQILRVADHGSRGGTDPGFIRVLNPEIAIVSTGSGNPSDNPASTTLNILQTAGAEVLRTDLDGTITITTDGSSYSISKLRMEPEITLSLVSVVETRAPG